MEWITPQPAYLMYPFEGGWQVMSYVRQNVFERTDDAARTWFDKAHEWRPKASMQDNALLKYWQYCIVGGFWLAGAAQYLSAMVLVALFLVMQFFFLMVWAALALILMGALMLFNYLYGSYYKIFFRCPNAGCYEQMTIPIYVCPSCAADHTRLWPSPYGVFHHRCSNCGAKLPTLNFLGRKDLVRRCVSCDRPMNEEIGRLTNIHIPVIGGPSTGKSNYIFSATHQFIADYAGPRQYTVEFPDPKDEQQYTYNMANLSSGRPLVKTPDIQPQAYSLALKRPKTLVGKIVYIYDAAGEAYSTEDAALLQEYYKHVHGLIFVVDPFSIDLYRRQHQVEIKEIEDSLKPSSLRVMDAYERMLTVLEASVGLERGRRFRHPIAVVVSKTDALELDQQIGPSAAAALMAHEPSIRLVEDATDFLVEQFLIDNELGNLVRDLYLQFEHVRFFSCSALGRMPDEGDSRPFIPLGVLEPLLWILARLDVVGSQAERVRHMDSEHRAMAKATDGFFKSLKYYYWDSLKPYTGQTRSPGV